MSKLTYETAQIYYMNKNQNNKATRLTTLTQILLCLKHNGLATKAPPITAMTLTAITFFVFKSTSFYKSTLDNLLALKS
ncbi:MAG: hypothetical protein ACYC6D_07950 [Melioribacteraceae bacterium]